MPSPAKTASPDNYTYNYNWVTFLLLVAVQLAPVMVVYQSGWLAQPGSLIWVSLAALVVGASLARIYAPQWLLHVLGFLLGLAVLGLAGASIVPNGTLYERLVEVIRRLVRWGQITQAGEASNDGVLFLLFLASMTWVIGYVGAFTVYRYRMAWAHLAGTGAALVVAVSYAENLGNFFFLYAPAAIVLFASVYGGNLQEHLSRMGVQHGSRLYPSFVRFGGIAAVFIVALSAWAPSVANNAQFIGLWQQVERPWREMQNEFSRLFGPVQTGGAAGASNYGPLLVLQGGVNLTDTAALEVRSPEPRRWRAVVYDRYTGRGWVTEQRDWIELDPYEEGLEAATVNQTRRDIVQTITVLRTKGDLLFGASLPKSVSIPVRAELENWSAGQGGRDSRFAYTDLASIRAAVGPYRGQTYTVVSSVSAASAEALRSAGTDYPQRIWQRYTSLPRGVSPRVRALARALTREYDNPYDKAVALETYLRGFTYNLQVSPPPEERDVVDYFLFESQEGYCDYFSSAMVVMLRSIGIPARVVAGYLPGSWDADRELYIVRESDSHSWPEVYFPGYGWIEFDPTASAPLVQRATDESLLAAAPAPEAASEAEAPEAPVPAEVPQADPFDELGIENMPLTEGEGPTSQSTTGFEIPLWLLAGVGAVVGSALMVSSFWRRSFEDMRPAEATYAKMAQVAGWLGQGPRPHQTPYEFAESLARAVPRGAHAIHTIARAYVRHRFGKQATVDAELAEEGLESVSAWRALRLLLPRGLALWLARNLLLRR